MCTKFQPMRFNVGSVAILLLAQSDITTFIKVMKERLFLKPQHQQNLETKGKVLDIIKVWSGLQFNTIVKKYTSNP